MKYKIYLINLDQDKDRLLFMDSQFKKLKLEYERIPAINGKEYLMSGNFYLYDYDKSKSENINKNITGMGRALTPGELGCAISHQICYENFLASTCDFALIMEDDVILHDQFKDVIQNLMNSPSQNFDFLQFTYPYIGTFGHIYSNFKIKLNYELELFLKNKKLSTLIRFLMAPTFNMVLEFRCCILTNLFKGVFKNFWRNYAGAGCYLINKKAATALRSISPSIVYTADILLVHSLFNMKNIISASFYPPMARQDQMIFESSIDKFGKRS